MDVHDHRRLTRRAEWVIKFDWTRKENPDTWDAKLDLILKYRATAKHARHRPLWNDVKWMGIRGLHGGGEVWMGRTWNLNLIVDVEVNIKLSPILKKSVGEPWCINTILSQGTLLSWLYSITNFPPGVRTRAGKTIPCHSQSRHVL